MLHTSIRLHEEADTAFAGDIVPRQLSTHSLNLMEIVAEGEQVSDVAVELAEPLGKDAEHTITWGNALITCGENFGNITQTNAEAPGAGNEAQPLDIGRVIAPVVVGRSLRRRQQPDRLVVADRLGRHPACVHQIPYLHR